MKVIRSGSNFTAPISEQRGNTSLMISLNTAASASDWNRGCITAVSPYTKDSSNLSGCGNSPSTSEIQNYGRSQKV